MIATSDDFRAGRHKLGLSIGQLEHLTGVDSDTLRKWERGDRDPHPAACRILELALGGFIMPEVLMRLIAGRGMP